MVNEEASVPAPTPASTPLPAATSTPPPAATSTPPAATPKELHGWLPMAIGVLAVVVGAVWALQGLNVLTDSQMSDEQIWAVIGPAVAVVGLILIIYGARRRASFKRRQAASAAS